MEHFELSACLVETEAVHKTKNSPTSLTSLISNKGSFAIDEKFPLVHVDATWNEVSDALSSQVGFLFYVGTSALKAETGPFRKTWG